MKREGSRAWVRLASGAFIAVGPPLTDPPIFEWRLGGFKSETKWANQMAKRGWTPEQISEAIQRGEAFSAPNKVNPGNTATRYVHPETTRSVVVDDATREVLHVGGDGFDY
jgi:hypothetical protein